MADEMFELLKAWKSYMPPTSEISWELVCWMSLFSEQIWNATIMQKQYSTYSDIFIHKYLLWQNFSIIILMFHSQSSWYTQFCRVKFCMTPLLMIVPAWLYGRHTESAHALDMLLTVTSIRFNQRGTASPYFWWVTSTQ